MVYDTLTDWLDYIDHLPMATISLGLDRVKAVAERLTVMSFDCPVITVAGTNGKGSTIAALQAAYQQAGYTVGAFTSPYLFEYGEQICIGGVAASEATLCQAFEVINQARADILLSEFEFCTLAALLLFQAAACDVILLEIGLGGGGDAVNIVEPDVAIITSVALDHQKFLGHTREEIATHKAGIIRAKKPVIYGVKNECPQTILDRAAQLKALLCYPKKPSVVTRHLDPVNLAIAEKAIALLQIPLPIKSSLIDAALAAARLPGRFQIEQGPSTIIYDVAHNPEACENLAMKLQQHFPGRRFHFVVGMQADKDVKTCLSYFTALAESWHLATLPLPRGASAQHLQQTLLEMHVTAPVTCYHKPSEALRLCLNRLKSGELTVVFGSFSTVKACFNR